MKKLHIGLLLLTLITWGCDSKREAQAPATKSESLKKLEFLIDWQAEPTYLGVYFAQQSGLFRKQGWDVEIVQSWGANQAVAAIAAGKYRIGTASGGATVLAYNSGAKIVSLGVLYPRIPTVIYGLAKTNVKNPNDLVDKTIGIYPGSITSNEFDAFIRTNKLPRERMKVVSLSGPDIPLLLAGQVDAVLHYTEMSPIAVSLRSDVPQVNDSKVFELRLADLGVGGYGLNIVASRAEYSRDPAGLKAVASAVVQGYAEGCKNPQEAVASFLKVFPDKDRAYVEQSWSRVCQLLGTNPGSQTSQGWEETIKLYRDLNLLKVPITAADVLP